MVTPQFSGHPVLEELATLFRLYPSPLETPNFEKCLVKTIKGHCCTRSAKIPEDATKLWNEFKKMGKYPVRDAFYADINRFIQSSQCGSHIKTSDRLFKEWKKEHCAYHNLTDAPTEPSRGVQELDRVLKEDPDEAPQPETPESEIFDSSCFSDTSPFPTPLTEPDAPRTPIKGPAPVFDIHTSGIQPEALGHVPSSVADGETPSISSITKEISTLSLSHARQVSDMLPINGKPATAEGISEYDYVSWQQTTEAPSVVPARKPIAEQINSDAKATKVEDNEIAIEGIGMGHLNRRGTLKRQSPILKALTTPPTLYQRKRGIVYVLQHTKNERIFKIGFSEYDANTRRNQSGNCYKINTEVIYESETAFAGAHKAEQLAHVFLGNRNLQVAECESCRKGHKEWYYDPTETVIVSTLQVMEDFVRMPAYELKAGQEEEGELVLSQEAERRIKAMCNISIQGLQGPESTQKEAAMVEVDSRESVQADFLSATHTAVPLNMADVPIESVEREGLSNEPLAKPPQKTRVSSAATIGWWTGTFKKKVQQKLSRENTPEPDEFREPPKGPNPIEKFSVGLLWALKGGKSEETSKGEGISAEWNSFVQAVVDRKDKFKKEFTEGVREGEAAK
ncbi:hypothetical protein FLONG3_179 [Fusarium longipes]|uniref:Bacteriophage T5 Orf172 DNA-binding domain-containing protein n=1 Tax=Fusarium longipes TaxID=694270 RepID=A0A395TBH5_9HYPO|nr:hypothetical protein FLONG3_179 [Fusarium longipes]